MQPGALRALEFDRIVEAVSSFALTPMGAERLARPAPSTDPQQVAQLLAATTRDRRAIVAANGAVPAARVERPAADSRALAVEGRRSKRCGCSRSRRFSIRSTRRAPAIRRAPGSFPLLEAASGGAASFKGETAQVREKIDPSGEVVDHASPELRLIRERLRKQRTRLRSTLESYLRGKETAKYLQDQVVTERNGRYVLRRQGRAPQRDSRASCTARRPAAPACFSSRSARSKSTTTSSRSRSRKPKKSGASCSR